MGWESPKPPVSEAATPQHSPAPTPSRAVYGFVLWLLSLALLLLYSCWALVPPALLPHIGLEFLPQVLLLLCVLLLSLSQRYWAIALPTYLSVLFLTLVLVVYPALGMLATPGEGDLRQATDFRVSYSTGSIACFSYPSIILSVEGCTITVLTMSVHFTMGWG